MRTYYQVTLPDAFSGVEVLAVDFSKDPDFFSAILQQPSTYKSTQQFKEFYNTTLFGELGFCELSRTPAVYMLQVLVK